MAALQDSKLRLTEIGTDFIVVEDFTATTEIPIPVYAIKSIKTVRLKK